MSKVVKGVKKVFKKVVKVIKKVVPIVLAAAAIYFTAGAALGATAAWGGASGVAAGITSSLGTGVLGTTVTGAVTAAGYGAAIGGVVSAAQGGSFSQGAKKGAIAGAITGGAMGLGRGLMNARAAANTLTEIDMSTLPQPRTMPGVDPAAAGGGATSFDASLAGAPPGGPNIGGTNIGGPNYGPGPGPETYVGPNGNIIAGSPPPPTSGGGGQLGGGSGGQPFQGGMGDAGSLSTGIPSPTPPNPMAPIDPSSVAGGGGGGGGGGNTPSPGFLEQGGWLERNQELAGGAIKGIGQGLMSTAAADSEMAFLEKQQQMNAANYLGTDPGANYRDIAPVRNDRYDPKSYGSWEYQYDAAQGRIIKVPI